MFEKSRHRSALVRAIANPPHVPEVRERSDVAGLARRRVRDIDLLGHSVAVVAPSASALSMPFVVAFAVGPGAWLSAALGFALAFLLASSFSQFATRIAAPGSMYTWVARSLGPFAGLMVGASMLAGYGTLVAFGVSNTIRRSAEAVSSFSAGGLRFDAGQQLGVGVIAVLICLVISVRGIALSTRVALIAESALLVSLIVLVLVAVIHEGLPPLGVFSLSGADPWLVLVGATMIMGITVGFESSAALGAEAEKPFLNVPRSLFGSLGVSATLYALAFVAANAIMTSEDARHEGPAQRWFPASVDVHIADGILSTLLAIGFLTLSLCGWNALARVLFSFSREGILPTWLGRTHARWNSPIAALLAVAPLVLVPSVIAVVIGEPIGSITYRLLGAAVLTMVIAYALVALAVPVFLRELDECTVGPVLVAVVAFSMTMGFAVVDAVEGITDGSWLAIVLTGTALAGACVWYLWLRMAHGRALRRMGALHDETVVADLLGR